MVIWKHQLRVPGTTKLELPAGFKVVDVAFQREELYVWVLQRTDGRANREIEIKVVETGAQCPGGMEHLATAHGLWAGGPYVAHAFCVVRDLP